MRSWNAKAFVYQLSEFAVEVHRFIDKVLLTPYSYDAKTVEWAREMRGKGHDKKGREANDQ